MGKGKKRKLKLGKRKIWGKVNWDIEKCEIGKKGKWAIEKKQNGEGGNWD